MKARGEAAEHRLSFSAEFWFLGHTDTLFPTRPSTMAGMDH